MGCICCKNRDNYERAEEERVQSKSVEQHATPGNCLREPRIRTQDGHKRAEGERVQSNFCESSAIPVSVRNISEVSINVPPAGEDVRPQVPPVKPRDKVTTKKPKDGSSKSSAEVSTSNNSPGEEGRPAVKPSGKSKFKSGTEKSKDGGTPYDITKTLARCTDLQLYRITARSQEQLESAIRQMSERNIEEIRQLTRSTEGYETSQPLLKSVLLGDIQNCRMFWNILSKTEVNPQDLITVLNKDVEDDGSPYDITKALARCTDLKLYGITASSQEQLESAMRQMSERNIEEIRQLTRSTEGLDTSQPLLKSVLLGAIQNCRMFWNILSKTQVNPQDLITLLKKDVEEEVILEHKYNLRVQSMSMKMPSSRLISDIYNDPLIIMRQPEHSDETTKDHSQLREVASHELLKRHSSDTEKSNISVVYGAAGTGKSTLIQKIIHDWSMGMIYEEFRFVLHLKVRNLNAIKCKTSLSRLIVDTYPYLENYLADLWKEPRSLLFIFDDLNLLDPSAGFTDDERNSDPRHRCTGPESVCLVQDILRCLLQGEFLKGCSVLITARLWKHETLRHVTADSTFQVVGFTSQKVKEYFSRYLRYGQCMNEVVQLIKENDILRNMSSNPLFCYTLASQPQREDLTPMPLINHTQLLFDYFVLLLRECGYDDKTTLKCLIEVGELAYVGITRNTLSFEAEALSQLDNCPANFTSAFITQDPDKQNCGVVYEFKHSAVRDFLAALAKILNTPTAQLKGLLDAQFTDTTGRFRTFSLFLVGLSSQKLTDRLKLQLCYVPSDIILCTSEWFRNSVKRRLINMDGNYAQHVFLHTLYCIIGFGDHIITKEVLAPIKTIKLNQLLTSADCTVLSRTLIYSELIEELDLSSSLPQPEEIQKLAPILHRCVILRLNQNNLQDSGVKYVLKILEKNDSKIQTLELKSNHLTDDCLGELFFALRTNRSLTLLKLSNSSQDGQHNNKFTHETLQHHVDNFAQRKEIRLLRSEDIGLDTTSNLLYIITD